MSTKQGNTNYVKNQGKPFQQQESKPILVKDFDIKKLKVLELKGDGEFNKNQFTAWVKYNNENLNVQTPVFQITQYGVPGFFAEYNTTEKQRLNMKFPLDDQPGCNELKQFFGKLEKKLKDEKLSLLGEQVIEDVEDEENQFKLKEITRTPKKETKAKLKEIEEKWKSQNKDFSKRTQKCQFWRAKLDVDFKTGAIKTPVWLRDPDWEEKHPGVPETMKDMTKVMPRNADHLTEIMPYGSTVKLIFSISNFFADKTALAATGLNYGFNFKIKMIECTPRKQGPSLISSLADYAFVDTNVVEDAPENEDAPEGETVEGETVEGETEEAGDEEAGDEEEGGDEESGEGGDEESEEKPVEPIKKVVPTKVTSPTKPVVKPVTKPIKPKK